LKAVNRQADKKTNKNTTTQKTKIENHKSHKKTQVHRRGKQFMLHYWNPSCYSCYKSDDKSWEINGGIHRYSLTFIQVMMATLKLSKWLF